MRKIYNCYNIAIFELKKFLNEKITWAGIHLDGQKGGKSQFMYLSGFQ